MIRASRLALFSICLLGSSLTSTVNAAPGDTSNVTDAKKKESREAFRKGVEKLKESNFEGARREFETAYSLFPHPSILLNLGIAQNAVKDYVAAEKSLATFLADDTEATADETQAGKKFLNEVREHIGTLKLNVTPPESNIFVDKKPLEIRRDQPGVATTIARLSEGDHVVRLEAAGKDPFEEKIKIIAKEELTKTVILKEATKTVAAKEPVLNTPANSGSGLTTLQWVGIGLTGGAAVAAGFGVYLGLRSKSNADTYNALTYQEQQTPNGQELRSNGKSRALFADILFGTAIAMAGTGIALIIVGGNSKPKENKPAASLYIGPLTAGFTGKF